VAKAHVVGLVGLIGYDELPTATAAAGLGDLELEVVKQVQEDPKQGAEGRLKVIARALGEVSNLMRARMRELPSAPTPS
jgi:hypothetical protein